METVFATILEYLDVQGQVLQALTKKFVPQAAETNSGSATISTDLALPSSSTPTQEIEEFKGTVIPCTLLIQ